MAGTTGRTILNDISDVVGKSAPLLGALLGSPLASIGVSLLSSVFNVKPDQQTELLEAIKNDPDALIKLRQLENEHDSNILQALSQNYATEVDDRKNARAREVALHDHIPTLLSVGFLIIYSIIQLYCVTHDNSVNDIISARLQDILIMIVSYYFGSSHKEKQSAV